MKPRKYTARFVYEATEIPFHFWANTTAGKPDCIIFLGAGQVGNIPRWVAAAAGPGVVVVDGLPHWAVAPSTEAIRVFSAGYIAAAFAAVRKTFGLTTVHVITESQAVPATVILARTIPEQIGNVVLVRPLGFSVRAFGASEAVRLQVFRRRIVRTMLQLPQSFLHDPRNFGVTASMLRAMIREPNFKSLTKKYAIGISYDLLEDCKAVAVIQKRKKRSFTMLLGEKDKMFPPKEIMAALAAHQNITPDVQIVPRATHASLAVRGSKVILKLAVQTARGDQP